MSGVLERITKVVRAVNRALAIGRKIAKATIKLNTIIQGQDIRPEVKQAAQALADACVTFDTVAKAYLEELDDGV